MSYPNAPACLGERGGAKIDRVRRNTTSLVAAEPALRPVEVIFAWAEESQVQCDPSVLIDLAERLRGARLLFTEDGALNGSWIVSALREQVDLMKDEAWPMRNHVRILADETHRVLGEMGLL